MPSTPRLVLIASLFTLAAACAHQPKAQADSVAPPPVQPEPPKVSSGEGSTDAESRRVRIDRAVVHYGLDSAQLSEEGRATLDAIADELRARRATSVTLAGHTCDLGTTEYNLALSQRRASLARDYLALLGVDRDRIKVSAYGEEAPAAQGESEEVRSQNRRTEVELR